jgi:hypothetical protein
MMGRSNLPMIASLGPSPRMTLVLVVATTTAHKEAF